MTGPVFDQLPVSFIQYERPNGKPTRIEIQMPHEVAQRSYEITKRGYRLEAEVLVTGQVSFTIADDRGDHAIEVCDNGPAVLEAVKRLIMGFKGARHG